MLFIENGEVQLFAEINEKPKRKKVALVGDVICQV